MIFPQKALPWVGVSNVSAKSGRLSRVLNASTSSFARTVMDTDLTTKQQGSVLGSSFLTGDASDSLPGSLTLDNGTA
jgi:hypothetical protein